MSLRHVVQYHSAGVVTIIYVYLNGSTSSPFCEKEEVVKICGVSITPVLMSI